MSSPQSGILPEANQHALFITLSVAGGSESAQVIKEFGSSLFQVGNLNFSFAPSRYAIAIKFLSLR